MSSINTVAIVADGYERSKEGLDGEESERLVSLLDALTHAEDSAERARLREAIDKLKADFDERRLALGWALF